MQITEIRIRQLKAVKNGLIGFATIVIDKKLVLRDFAVFEHGGGRLSVALPGKKKPDGSWDETVSFICTDFDNYVKNEIIRAFEDERARPDFQFSR